jgi:hypothetical protein
MSKLELATYAFAFLGFLVSMASAASLTVKKDSTLGLWLAWFASMPLKHMPVKREQSEEKLVKRITLGSLFVAFLVLPGCTGTFEEARLAQPGALQASPVRVASGRCVALSDREYWFGVASIGAGSTGLGAVITAIPASDKFETSLVIAGASAAAVSVVSGIASQKAGTQYVKEGCAK